MKSDDEFSLSAIARKRGASSSRELAVASTTVTVTPSGESRPSPSTALAAQPAQGFRLPFDPLRLIDAMFARRWLALAAGVLTAGLLGYAGWKHFETHHVAMAQLIKQAPSTALRQGEGGDPYQPHDMTIPTFVALMRSGPVMESAVKTLGGKMSEAQLRAGLTITPERNTDIIRVTMNSDKDGTTALEGLRAYVDEVLRLTRDMQQRDAAEMNRFLKQQIALSEQDQVKVNEELLEYGKREHLVDAEKQIDAWLGELGNYSLKYEGTRLDFETLDLKITSIEHELAKVSPAAAKLQTVRDELAHLQLRYTDEHPSVLEAKERVKALEADLKGESPHLDSPPKPGESAVAESLYLDLVKLRSEKQVLGEQLSKLSAVRDELNERLSQLPRKAMDLARIKSRKASLENAKGLLVARQREAALSEENAQGSFRLLSMARDQDVSVERPTKKLGMVVAGGFAGAAGLLALAFGLLALLDPRLLSTADLKRATNLPVLGSLRADTGMTSAEAEEWAFRTWTNLHPSLVSKVSGGPIICGLLSEVPGLMPLLLGAAAARRGASVIVVSRQPGQVPSEPLSSALEAPGMILQRLGREPEEVVHLCPDPDWQWTAQQRQHWTAALAHWSSARNTLVLVELTEPDRAETLLVAERLQNLLWVGSGSTTQVSAVQRQIQIYRAAGCRMVGALLDQAPAFRLGLLNKLAVATLLMGLVPAHAAESTRLGAVDIVNLTIAGQPELQRTGVTIGPDGTITYLQAQGIHASGLTIDELRASLNAELSRFYKNAIVIVTPNLFQSDKVYVLGKIVKKGAITLTRPLTILEVVAEAGGLETGLFQQNTVELADLGRSLLVRGANRMPVNMEALFLHGDMSQNIQVQAGDYLYFPSANSNEIYVLGDVKMQGTQGLLAHTSVLSAITQAGGFTPKAYTRRVLVVRGSLDKPQTFVVNLNEALSARAPGFRLEPKDIVYVTDKPWARAEELMGFAVNAFMQGAVSGWATTNVGPLIKRAILPGIQ